MLPHAFGRSLAAAILTFLAATASAQDRNRPVANARDQFHALTHHGDWMAFYGDPDIELKGTSHWQGIQRFNGPGRAYLFLTTSANSSDDTRGSLIVVEMGSRDFSGERLRSNRLVRGMPTETSPPPDSDRIVARIVFGQYEHIGAMQLVGNILAVPLEEKRLDDVPEGKVNFYDVSDPVHPALLGALSLPQKAGVVAMTDLPDGRFLLLVAGGDGRTLRVFRSTAADFQAPGFEFEPIMDWDGHTQLENGLWPYTTDGGTFGPKTTASHQTLNFVKQTNGALFLIGIHNTHNHSPVIRGADVAVLYEVLNASGPLPLRIREVEGHHFSCSAEEAGRSCNFNAGGGVYVSPTGELLLYATEHYADGPNGTVQFAEYRNTDVFRPGNPRYFPTVNPGGPYVVDEGSVIQMPGQGGPPSARAWVQLYEDANGWLPQHARMVNPIGGAASWSFDGPDINRSVMSDHGDFLRDDFSNLTFLDGFNDKASAVRWWAPPGCSIFLIQHVPPGPRHIRLRTPSPFDRAGFLSNLKNVSMCNADGDDCVNADEQISSINFNMGCDQPPAYAAEAFTWTGFPPPSVGRLENDHEDKAQLVGLDGPWTGGVTLQVCIDGVGCAGGETTVTVRNVAPVMDELTIVVDADGLVRIAAHFHDAGKSDTHTATVFWGDGRTDAGGVTEADGRGVVDATHRYERPGTYTIEVTVADDDAAKGSAERFVSIADREPPRFIGAIDKTAEAQGPYGAELLFRVEAFDDVDGTVPIDCQLPADRIYPLGATVVRCTAMDSAGNAAEVKFTITVVDTTPPQLIGLADIAREADRPGGAEVFFVVTARDLVDGRVPSNCVPRPGTLFPVGTTIVTCRPTDSRGNEGFGSMTVQVGDTVAPELTLPEKITVEATGPEGAAVEFAATAHDFVSGDLPVVCDRPSGSTFPLGGPLSIVIVTCHATDPSGNRAEGAFGVSVVDTTPPAITVPADVRILATGAGGAAVMYAAGAIDLVDGIVPVACVPPAGSLFPIGPTVVNCEAMDRRGNRATRSFQVTVYTTSKPVLTVPDLVKVDAQGPQGSFVTFETSAWDLEDGMLPVSCAPASGSFFPIGKTWVECQATDSHGNTRTARFALWVRDLTAPTLTLPADIIVNATSPLGATVPFTVTTWDLVDQSVSLWCSNGSGAKFPVGVTVVSCKARDDAQNETLGSFTVTVLPMP